MRNKVDYIKLVSSFLLGDGHLTKIHEYDGSSRHGKNSNSRYSLTQIAKHRDYVEWQRDILSELTDVTITEKESWSDVDGTNHQSTLYLRTKTLPLYTDLYRRWYMERGKVLSIHDLKLMDWQMSAILYMDDGSVQSYIKKNNEITNRITLYTYSFSEAENKALRDCIAEKFGVHFGVYKAQHKSNFHYYLRCGKDNAKRWIDGVERYILPSFTYKLGRVAPEEVQDEDIVSSE